MALEAERECKEFCFLVRRRKYDRPFNLSYRSENGLVTHSLQEHRRCYFPARFVDSTQPRTGKGKEGGQAKDVRNAITNGREHAAPKRVNLRRGTACTEAAPSVRQTPASRVNPARAQRSASV